MPSASAEVVQLQGTRVAAVHLQAVGTCPLAGLTGSLLESFGGRAAGPCLRPAAHKGVLAVQEQG